MSRDESKESDASAMDEIQTSASKTRWGTVPNRKEGVNREQIEGEKRGKTLHYPPLKVGRPDQQKVEGGWHERHQGEHHKTP